MRLLGLSELTFRRKEELRTGVEAALDLPGAYDNAGSSQSSSSSSSGRGSVGGLSVGVQTALRYISNCRQDIQVQLLYIILLDYAILCSSSVLVVGVVSRI